MLKLVSSLILLCLAQACGRGFDKDKDQNKVHRTQEAQEVGTFAINQEYLSLMNDHRIKKGLRPLDTNPIIEKVAFEHSKGMATHNRAFDHRGLTQRCRKIKTRLAPFKLCSEIIGKGQKTPNDILRAWLASDGHRKELEQARFTHTGLGIYKDDLGVIYWTQLFVEL